MHRLSGHYAWTRIGGFKNSADFLREVFHLVALLEKDHLEIVIYGRRISI